MTKTTDLTVYRDAAGDLAAERAEADGALEHLRAFEIQTDQDRDFAIDVIRDIKQKHTALETRRKNVTRPLAAVTKEVNSWFAPITTALHQAEQMLKAKVVEYGQRIERENHKALLAAAAAKTPEQTQEALALVTPAPSAPAGVVERKRWNWAVEDRAAVPREYLTIDPAKVEAHMREATADGRDPVIPGLKFWQYTVLAVGKGTP